MSHMLESLPSDLRQALIRLEADASEPSDFERVARWRRACGDAHSAAQWQTWSLLPPDTTSLHTALAECWRRVGALERAGRLLATQVPGWNLLAVFLDQNDTTAACQLQEQLLNNPPAIEGSDLLDLVSQWRDRSHPAQALALLNCLIQHLQRQGQTPSLPVTNACADLLEQLERFDDATTWWHRSLQLDPNQAWPMLQLAQIGLRKNQPELCVHYSRAALAQDSQHQWARQLLRDGLIQLGAHHSLQLLEGLAPTGDACPDAPCSVWPEPERCDVVGLWRLSEPIGLDSCLQHRHPHTIWLINSPDPLWLRQRVEQVLERHQLNTRVQLHDWPVWDRSRWPDLDVLIHPASAPAPADVPAAQITCWTVG